MHPAQDERTGFHYAAQSVVHKTRDVPQRAQRGTPHEARVGVHAPETQSRVSLAHNQSAVFVYVSKISRTSYSKYHQFARWLIRPAQKESEHPQRAAPRSPLQNDLNNSRWKSQKIRPERLLNQFFPLPAHFRVRVFVGDKREEREPDLLRLFEQQPDSVRM